MKFFRHLISRFRGDQSPESISAACDAVIVAATMVERCASIWAFSGKGANDRLIEAIDRLTEEIKKAKL